MTGAEIAVEIRESMERRTAAGGFGTFSKTVTGLNCRLAELVALARATLEDRYWPDQERVGAMRREMNVFELCRMLES